MRKIIKQIPFFCLALALLALAVNVAGHALDWPQGVLDNLQTLWHGSLWLAALSGIGAVFGLPRREIGRFLLLVLLTCLILAGLAFAFGVKVTGYCLIAFGLGRWLWLTFAKAGGTRRPSGH